MPGNAESVMKAPLMKMKKEHRLDVTLVHAGFICPVLT